MKIDPAIVRRLREQRAWSQEQLADIAGLSARTVQRIENGGSASLETRMALATALDATPSELCAPPADAVSAVSETSTQADGRLRELLRRYQVLIIGLAIVCLLVFVIAYQVGKDLAARDNRADCEAAGRTDCR